MLGNSVSHLCCTFTVLFPSRNFRLSIILCAFISSEILRLTSENSQLVNQRKSNPFLSEQSLWEEGCFGGIVLESEGLDVQRGLNFWVVEW
jgi:hypothetical protein